MFIEFVKHSGFSTSSLNSFGLFIQGINISSVAESLVRSKKSVLFCFLMEHNKIIPEKIQTEMSKNNESCPSQAMCPLQDEIPFINCHRT